MRVYLIRHGETEYNRLMKMQGHAEIPLNDLGIRQAARMARRFTGVRLDRIYASDLRRATMTAAILAAHTGAPLIYDEGLRERDPGELTHKDYQESLSFFTDPTYDPPGGESHPEFLKRVRQTFEALIEREVAREAWEQGAPGSGAAQAPVEASLSPESGRSNETESPDAEGSTSPWPSPLDPHLQDSSKVPHPREQFVAPSGANPASTAAEKAPAGGSSAEWDAISPIAVPAAPGIELDTVPHLALVTHGMVCRAFVELFAPDAPEPGLRWLNTSISILDYHPADNCWHVHQLADASHLEEHDVSPRVSEESGTGSSTGG